MTNRPPDLEDIIARAQKRTIGADGGVHEGKPKMTISDVSRIVLGVGLAVFAVSLLVTTNKIQQNIDKATQIIDRSTVVMEKLPAATDRMEKLLERVDTSVQRGFNGFKETAPSVTEGLIDGLRNGLNREPK